MPIKVAKRGNVLTIDSYGCVLKFDYDKFKNDINGTLQNYNVFDPFMSIDDKKEVIRQLVELENNERT